ncbi:hypothetical protein CH370_09635 [Leptospira kmetyi]|uniref:hypothetical protein n=1 Tax=Leptospira kmetyi TaxID=408139 RepID=UPI000C298CCE|nr:hypothetical protein [Leptospira kmetyi]PJZ41692.1 hypothetical protein CH370_09635 [Leptospira kmetyi]
MTKKDYVQNQVFIGCPWKTIKPKYERVVDDLAKKYPLSFVIIGREETQDAEDLFGIIKNKLLASSYAIFDATGGNANVSLEYGLAEGADVPRILYISEHRASKKATKEHPIVSDLAGKKRNIYKTEASMKKLLEQFSKNHNYTKRFDSFLRAHYKGNTIGKKKRKKALCLKIIHSLDSIDKVRRNDLLSTLQSSNYSEEEVNNAINSLHKAKLINSSVGRYSDITI